MMSDKKRGAEIKAKWWRVKETEQSLKESKTLRFYTVCEISFIFAMQVRITQSTS